MSTATKKTSKIDVGTARELCNNATYVAGEGYVCPADQPGLVETALKNSDYEIEQELLELITELGFSETYAGNPELQEAIGPDAAFYFAGADKADKGEKTWEDSMGAGEQLYADCWEEYQATHKFDDGGSIDPALYDNFSQ